MISSIINNPISSESGCGELIKIIQIEFKIPGSGREIPGPFNPPPRVDEEIGINDEITISHNILYIYKLEQQEFDGDGIIQGTPNVAYGYKCQGLCISEEPEPEPEPNCDCDNFTIITKWMDEGGDSYDITGLDSNHWSKNIYIKYEDCDNPPNNIEKALHETTTLDCSCVGNSFSICYRKESDAILNPITGAPNTQKLPQSGTVTTWTYGDYPDPYSMSGEPKRFRIDITNAVSYTHLTLPTICSV